MVMDLVVGSVRLVLTRGQVALGPHCRLAHVYDVATEPATGIRTQIQNKVNKIDGQLSLDAITPL